MSDILFENDLWKIEIIEPGLIPNPILQRARGKFAFFDKCGKVYMPMSIYCGADKVNGILPQGTLIEWKDRCIEMFETKLRYNLYISLYNEMKGDINDRSK